MTRLAVSSDNHFDINKQALDAVIDAQAQFLVTQAIDVYLIVGDLFNSFAKSLAFVERLQTAVGPAMQIRFVAGNHDMGRDVSFDELESDINDAYLHNKRLALNDTWELIANNGWYDYSFAQGPQAAESETFKHGMYFDRVIKQPMSDRERTELSLQQFKAHLDAATAMGKQIITAQHFAPIKDDLFYPAHDTRWQMVNGVMGSKKYGELFAQYPNLQTNFYGHVHITVPPREINGVTYLNPSVGYNRRRLQEWTADTFIASWQNKLQIMVLTD
ncbi:MAG: metallophosphoesterase [Lactobacillaceae bacterium]|jgi:putative phosphoesterase|nr:metallophosphoesterase [Lactobacillaceae bacterium]